MLKGGIAIPKQSDSLENLKARIEAEVNKLLDEPTLNIEHTFEDSVIVRDFNVGKLFEIPYVDMEGQLVLGAPKEVDTVYVQVKKSKHEMTGAIVLKNAAQQIAYAAVLVPNEADYDGDVLTCEQIERAAHEWMASYRNVDLMHTLNNVAIPVESYILPMDMHVGKFVLPRGTWVLAAKVQDKDTWDKVEKGILTGYSVMGIKRTAFDGAMSAKNLDGVALKKTLLKDLGEDWVACAVSIVDEPAVPKAKFFAIKSQENTGVLAKLKEMLAPKQAPKEEEAQETINTSTPKEEPKEDNSSMDGQNIEYEALKAKVEALEAEVTALKVEKAKDGEEEGGCAGGSCGVDGGEGETGGEQGGEGGEDTEKEALKAKVAELEKQLAKKSATSQGLKGQDGEEAVKSKAATITGRDVFGRKRVE